MQNDNLQQLIDKVRNGKSTSEEELALLSFLNSSMETFLVLLEQVKNIKSTLLQQ